MSNRSKARLIYLIGILLCILPSTVCVAEYFPIWKRAHPSVLASGMLASGFSIAVIACVVIPPLASFLKTKLMGSSPSAWFGFMIVSIVLWVIQMVIRELAIIFTVAAVSNFLGALLFKISERIAVMPDPECDEEETDG